MGVSLPKIQTKKLIVVFEGDDDMLRKLKEQKGAAAVEYAMMGVFIAAVIVATVTLLGTKVAGLFSSSVAAW